MAMSPAMRAVLESKNPTLVYLVEIGFADRIVRLTDGGSVMWAGNLYSPEDPELGTINGFSEFTEMEGTESPRLEVYFEYKTNAALDRLAQPESQGTNFNIYVATIDRNIGNVISEPYMVFSGLLDTADLSHSKNNRMLTVYLSTAWELLFDNDEGMRWNNDFWTHTYGTNAQFAYAIDGVQKKLFWGYKGPSNGSGGGYGGSGGGFIGGDIGDTRFQAIMR